MNRFRKKNFFSTTPFIAFVFLFGCTSARMNPVVKSWDKVMVNYTCRLQDGSIAATTSKKIAEDETNIKSKVFLSQTVYAPCSITIGEEKTTSAKDFLKPFEKEIEEKISHLIEGHEIGKDYHLDIESNTLGDPNQEERFLIMARVWKRMKEKAIARENYLQLSKGTYPEIGQRIEVYPGLFGTVKSFDEKMVSVSISAQNGSEIPAPPFGMGIVHELEDHYEIEPLVKEGDLVRVGPYVGRIIKIDDTFITTDFGNPLGGERLKCDVRLEEIGQTRLEHATALLHKAADMAKQSDTMRSSIYLDENEFIEDPGTIQSGDLVQFHYTITTNDGRVYRTTIESIDHDPSIIKLNEYNAPIRFIPEELIVGELSDLPGLNEVLTGLTIGEKKRVALPCEKAFGYEDKNKIKTYSRIKRVPRTIRIPLEQYDQRYNKPPMPDDIVQMNPYFEAVVAEVKDNDVLLEMIAEDGQISEDGFGTTEIHLDGDDILFTLRPSIGAPFIIDGKEGMIVSANDENFVVDFNHPLAGRDILLDVEVVSITKASSLREMEIHWLENHEKGLEMGANEIKPILLLLYADWCQWSRRMIQETFQHPLIKSLKDKFIWLKINSDEQGIFKDIYHQDSYPLIVILNPDLEIISRIDTYLDARSLRKELNNCLNRLQKTSSLYP
ncbi:FKBP-type peptidyl-prolyl cis-trans isomerase [bacterium]|nr:FKBP-type peptidyl-prolyl cis-trans isomerase [bacterium]